MAVPTATRQPAPHSAPGRLVGLFHSSFDATTAAFGRTFVVPGNAFLSGFVIPSAVVAGIAALIVAFTRGRLAYRPNREVRPVDEASSGGERLANPWLLGATNTLDERRKS